jgi:hypothetical protein
LARLFLIIQSELKGLFDPLALQLAKEAQIAGNFKVFEIASI